MLHYDSGGTGLDRDNAIAIESEARDAINVYPNRSKGTGGNLRVGNVICIVTYTWALKTNAHYHRLSL